MGTWRTCGPEALPELRLEGRNTAIVNLRREAAWETQGRASRSSDILVPAGRCCSAPLPGHLEGGFRIPHVGWRKHTWPNVVETG